MDINDYLDKPGPQQERPRFTRETQSAGPIRDRQIHVNQENYWILRALVKSHNGAGGDPISRDSLTDAILTGYFHHNYPELVALYQERQAIDDKAQATLKSAAEKK